MSQHVLNSCHLIRFNLIFISFPSLFVVFVPKLILLPACHIFKMFFPADAIRGAYLTCIGVMLLFSGADARCTF
jgi:hypothetical protein